jgi:hypothetical protein
LVLADTQIRLEKGNPPNGGIGGWGCTRFGYVAGNSGMIFFKDHEVVHNLKKII